MRITGGRRAGCRRIAAVAVAVGALACVAGAGAARAHGAGTPLDVVFTEVSIYSLPHVVVRHEWGVAEGGTVVCDGPDPSLRVRFKMVDHSHGTNVDSHADFQVLEDEGFPYSDREEWVLVHEVNRITSNVQPDVRRVKEKTFNATGEKYLQVRLGRSRPVTKLKVVAHAKMYNPVASVLLRKPLDTHESTESRVFHLALRPRWAAEEHQGNGLLRLLRQILSLKADLLDWREQVTRVELGNRSLKDAAEFTPEALAAVLRNPLAPRDEMDAIASELLEEGDRAAGRPPGRLDPLTKDLLGVPRPSFSLARIRASLADRSPAEIAASGPMRNVLVAAGRAIDDGGIKLQLERTIGNVDLVVRALLYLWSVRDLGELKALAGGLDRALATALADTRRLVAILDAELGRDTATGSWLAIERSRLAARRFPTEAASDAARACMMLRGIFSDLLHLALDVEFHFRVAQAIAASIVRRLANLASRFRDLAPDPDVAFPPGLSVSAPTSTATIAPGQVAQYTIQVENRSSAEREVRIQEFDDPPSGWKTKLAPEALRLRPGEGASVHYALAVPYYAHEPVNHVSSVRIGWSDEPGLVHQPQFLTRLAVGGRLADVPGPAARLRDAPRAGATARRPKAAGGPFGPATDARIGTAFVEGEGREAQLHVDQAGDGLLVSTRTREHLVLEPGGVARYDLTVIHKGGGPRRVSMKLMTPVPDRWVVDVKPEEATLVPEVPARFSMRLAAPVDLTGARTVELLLGVGYTDEFARADRLAFRTVIVELAVVRSRPVINGGEVRTFYARTGAATTMMLEVANLGTVDDTFDLVIEEKPKGWYVHLDRTYLRVPRRQTPVQLPLTVRPPPGALTGEFERIVVRAVSIGHPEVSARQALTVAVRAPANFALEPLARRALVSPGTEGVLEFRARNVMDRAVRLAWKIAPQTAHPEWVHLDEPIQELDEGGEAILKVRVRVPPRVPLDRVYPVAVMALDEEGGQIVTAAAELVTIPVHRIRIRPVPERIVRTRTLMLMPLEVANLGSAPDTVALILEGKRRYWARVSHRRLRLNPGARFLVTLTVRIPVEAQYGQDADLVVFATSVKDGAARDSVRVGVAPPYMIRTNASTLGARTRF
jgi:hypothetical protein